MDKYIGFDVDSKKTVTYVIQKGERDRYTTLKTDKALCPSKLKTKKSIVIIPSQVDLFY
jgi:hypothetical protein